LKIDPITYRLWIIFITLQALDIFTTEAGLALGFKEINPIVAFILNYFGYFGLWAFKALWISFMGFWQGKVYDESVESRVKATRLLLIASSIIMIPVIGWNLIQILRVTI